MGYPIPDVLIHLLDSPLYFVYPHTEAGPERSLFNSL